MWKGELSSCLVSENIFGIPYPYWWDRKALLLVFRPVNSVQKADLQKTIAGEGWGWDRGGGQHGVEGGRNMGRILLMVWEFLCQNKITCIFPLMRDSGENMTKTHQCIHCFVCRPDQSTITQRYGWEMPSYCLWGAKSLQEWLAITYMKQF